MTTSTVASKTAAKKIFEYISKAAKTIDPKVKKTAVLGASTAQRIMLNIYSSTTGMNIKLFDDKEAALKYLIK